MHLVKNERFSFDKNEKHDFISLGNVKLKPTGADYEAQGKGYIYGLRGAGEQYCLIDGYAYKLNGGGAGAPVPLHGWFKVFISVSRPRAEQEPEFLFMKFTDGWFTEIRNEQPVYITNK